MSRKVSSLPSTPRILQLLEKEYAKSTIYITFKMRLGIIINGIKGVGNSESERELNVSSNTVRKWRSRWEESYEELIAKVTKGENGDGQGMKNYEIIKLVKTILSDNPRSGSPKRITLSQQEQIVTMATKKPEEYNIPMTSWTWEMLAFVAVSQGIVDTISRTHVGNILKKKSCDRIKHDIG